MGVHLCVHCRLNVAGFWVSRKGDTVTRRPWCLSCIEADLDEGLVTVVPINGKAR